MITSRNRLLCDLTGHQYDKTEKISDTGVTTLQVCRNCGYRDESSKTHKKGNKK